MITITDKAFNHIIDLMKDEGFTPTTYKLRVGVKGGGCSGLSYEMSFDNEIQSSDKVFEYNGLKIIVDIKSFLYLFDTQLDFTDGLNGKGFHFVNPNATRTCGCGESFSV